MTSREALAWVAEQPQWIGGYLVALPALAFLMGLSHPKGAGNGSPWKYLYSVLIYAAAVPGMLAAVICGYVLLMSNESFLDLNLLVTIAPVASMVVTLLVAGRNVDFGPLPGFGRISGLMTMIGLTFVVVLVLQKTRILLMFGGSIFVLVGAAAFVFALLKWGSYMAFRRRDEPEKAPPKFGE